MRKHLHLIFILKFCLLFFVSSVSAQTLKQIGMEHYKKKEYKQAISFLENAKKENPADFDAIFFLGISLINEGKLKQASENFEKAIELNPNHAKAHTWLAFALTQRGKCKEALATAEKSIALNAADAENYYLISSCKMRTEEWEPALENAEKAININPNLYTAYFLKARILIETSEDSKKDNKKLVEKYGSISKNFLKYITLLPKNQMLKEELDEINFFVKAYQDIQNKPDSKDDSSTKSVKVLKTFRPDYTDQARKEGISGDVRLLAAFGEDGKISHVLVMSGLGYGLDEQAIKAIKKTKFEPREENGKPVLALKTVIYNFSLY